MPDLPGRGMSHDEAHAEYHAKTAEMMARQVNVGPYTYAVTDERLDWQAVEELRGPAAYGYTSHTQQRIYLQPALHPAMRRTVLLHEVLHAAAFASGLAFDGDHSEEEWVLRVTPLLLDALARSHGLAAYLTGSGASDV
jgi:hypothetical protein